MDLPESIAVALEALRAHKLRSFLTMLGVIIGVAAVIALVSVGQTARSSVVGEFTSLGPDLLWVLPGKAKEDSPFPTEEARLTLTAADAQAIRREAAAVSEVAPMLQTSVEVSGGGRRTTTTVIGTSPTLLAVRGLALQTGRFLQEADMTRRRRVAVLGPALAQRLYRVPRQAVGRRLTVNGRAFEVVGVLQAQGSILGVDLDDRAYLPLPTTQQLFDITYVSFLFVKARDVESVPRAVRDTQRILLREHGEEDFTVLTQSQLLASLSAILRILTIALSSIAAISLVVGGIGIMNIMLVSVTERTREIGIRKAIGARRLDILTQFLVEAVGLSLVGGVLGMAVGLAISWGISLRLLHSAPTPASLLPVVVLAFSFSALVGVVFGVYPAWRAASLHPIEALRYE
ncbi:MAG: ABC transporter permease [Armatimonadota bacterium]|nr:ABC transporter permease [Armatimonadota bacterium]MDR7427465.1 ABC transporter permease [Armatimonadota bacterium]MDR7469975.1 ABC transporter permease [Armatimonadota bacterium]MDR7474481.1 ABC transporter permease [Armatimonadota bacterium]MDR7538743.1 ABC transporter permease [Armatimonadota bacterium]